MRQDKKRTDKVAIALVLCFCVVAIASVFTVKSGIDRLGNLSRPGIDIADITDQNRNVERSVIEPVPTVDSKENDVSNGQENRGNPQFIAPLTGTVILEYSKDIPIYSKTLNQYMVHEGIDIAAALDTQVKAISEGTIVDVYADDRYGTTIIINHGNGLCSIYSNLSTTQLVQISDVVEKGQVISGVGETALFETLDEPHLHFAMTLNGESVDPSQYVSF